MRVEVKQITLSCPPKASLKVCTRLDAQDPAPRGGSSTCRGDPCLPTARLCFASNSLHSSNMGRQDLWTESEVVQLLSLAKQFGGDFKLVSQHLKTPFVSVRSARACEDKCR